MKLFYCSVVKVPKRDAANHLQGNIYAREEGSVSIRVFVVKILIRDTAVFGVRRYCIIVVSLILFNIFSFFIFLWWGWIWRVWSSEQSDWRLFVLSLYNLEVENVRGRGFDSEEYMYKVPVHADLLLCMHEARKFFYWILIMWLEYNPISRCKFQEVFAIEKNWTVYFLWSYPEF